MVIILCAVCPCLNHSIQLRKLDGNSNIEFLAQNIIDKCDLIHPSRLPIVMNLLSDLQMKIVESETRPAITDDAVCMLRLHNGMLVS